MGKLTAIAVPRLAKGTYDDGDGLRLVVAATGSRYWVLRYQLHGKRRDMGIGSFPEVTLARAREKGLEARRLIKDRRIDPLAARGAERRLTFRQAAEALIESKQAAWKNAKHAAQWVSTLQTYVYPTLADVDARSVTTEAVLHVLTPIWAGKPETASRVRQRIEAVLDYAKARGVRSGNNSARWRGHLDLLLPKPSKVRAVEHHAALGWHLAPAFMTELADRKGVAARALAFTILTAARSGEVRGMRWGEIDLERSVWTIPAARMKAGKEHSVPLTSATLRLMGESGGSDRLVFAGDALSERILSDMSLTAVLKRMGRSDLTVHGFRSTFRDWAGETTAHPREVIEAALAHRLKDKAEAAYARGDLMTKRRRLMEVWARFLVSAPAEVVALRPAS